jgi:mediator of RNA polymerase II transcription subunit 5
LVYRYDLDHHDIGIPGESFIAQYLAKGHASIANNDLTPEQSKHLGGWLKGLFNPDGTESVGDDLMSSCRPQEFYLLVPTLFKQIVMAHTSELISLDTIKNGLECKFPTSLSSASFDACRYA